MSKNVLQQCPKIFCNFVQKVLAKNRPALSAIENGGEFKVQTLERLVSSLDVSEQYIMHGKTEDTKASLISEAVNVLSNMSELQIQQCLAMMKALKNVQITD